MTPSTHEPCRRGKRVRSAYSTIQARRRTRVNFTLRTVRRKDGDPGGFCPRTATVGSELAETEGVEVRSGSQGGMVTFLQALTFSLVKTMSQVGWEKMSISDLMKKLPLINSDSKKVRIFGYVVYAWLVMAVLGAMIPDPSDANSNIVTGADNITIEGHTFSFSMPDGWTKDEAEKYSISEYFEGYEGTLAYDYTGTYVSDAFRDPDPDKPNVSLGIVHVPPDEANEDSVDDVLRYLNGDMYEPFGNKDSVDSSKRYLDFDGKRAYLVEEQIDYNEASQGAMEGSANILTMTVALGENTYAIVYGYFRDDGTVWDVVKDMTID
jgi:hypothetical protein